MTILYPAPARVKPARRFGAGILPATPVERAPFPTFEDAAWWARESARLEGARLDRMAFESAAVDAMSVGLIPPDVAEAVMTGSLVGHRP